MLARKAMVEIFPKVTFPGPDTNKRRISFMEASAFFAVSDRLKFTLSVVYELSAD
ncbi:MAG: hypothetical protein NTX44_14480 [Ignavibacteriales bacterium]|nr:hypothetical protein [Ignavibacteriales bacterium]